MSRTLTVTTSPASVSTSKAIAEAATVAPLLVITYRAFCDLAAELGSDEAATCYLLRVSEQIGRPLGVNFETGDGSRTCFLAPRSWTQERLAGWIGAKHDDLEDAFGTAVPMSLEDL